jgi:hypothetical protein
MPWNRFDVATCAPLWIRWTKLAESARRLVVRSGLWQTLHISAATRPPPWNADERRGLGLELGVAAIALRLRDDLAHERRRAAARARSSTARWRRRTCWRWPWNTRSVCRVDLDPDHVGLVQLGRVVGHARRRRWSVEVVGNVYVYVAGAEAVLGQRAVPAAVDAGCTWVGSPAGAGARDLVYRERRHDAVLASLVK